MRRFNSIPSGSSFQLPDDLSVYTKIDDDTYAKRGGKFKECKGKMEVIPVIERRLMVISLVKGLLKSDKKNQDKSKPNVFIPQGMHGRLKTIDGETLTVVFDEVFHVNGDGSPGEVLVDHEVAGISSKDVFYNNVEVIVERVQNDAE